MMANKRVWLNKIVTNCGQEDSILYMMVIRITTVISITLLGYVQVKKSMLEGPQNTFKRLPNCFY